MSLPAGTRIADRYELLRAEAEAPAYRAYRALDREVEVEIALWLVRGELLPDETARQIFCADALRARRVAHASLRKLFDAGVHAGAGYVALQPLDGESLAARIAAGKIPPAEAAAMGLAIADALTAAHAAHLVHGRLRPADVTLAGGLPKLGGVGLWSALDRLGARLAFTPDAAWLAPEVRAGEPAGARADSFALGTIVTALALGAPPSADALDRLHAVAPRLAATLERALDPDPGRRPSCAELAVALGPLTRPDEEEDAPTRHYLALPETPAPELAGAPPPELTPGPTLEWPRIATPLEVPIPPAPAPAAPVAPPAASPAAIAAPAASAPAIGGPPAPPPPLAPPARPRRARGSRRAGLVVAVGAAAVALVAAAGFAVYTLGSTPAEPGPPPAPRSRPVVSPTPPAAPVVAAAAPCPPGARLVVGAASFCIDTHEFPGEGFTPVASVTLDQARQACESRGRRLCRPDEWERGCRGTGGASYPYGETYLAGRCNLRGGAKAQLAASGGFSGCVSAIGVFDMSGNVAEWVEGGATRGGSVADGDDGRCSRDARRPAGFAAPDVGFRCCADPGAY